MKRFVLPLVVLTVLVGACSSPTKTTQKPSGPPVNTGTRTTAWGELPTYDSAGQSFIYARTPYFPLTSPATKSVIVDVVVNADGSVKDATVVDGAGDPVFNYAVLGSFVGARYSLQLGPNDPAPYVVRQTMEFRRESWPTLAGVNPYGDVGRQDSSPQQGAPYYQTWSGANGGWSGGGGWSSSSSSSSGSSTSSK